MIRIAARPTLQSRPNLLNVRLLDSLPMPMLRRMMRTGIAIDLPKLKGLSAQMGERMRELEVEVRKHVPLEKWNEFVGKDTDADEQPGLLVEEKQRELPQINVNSAEQMAWFLFDVLGLGAGRNLKRTADGRRISTGKKQLELLKEEHGVIQLLLEYRENHKLKTTYADALPKKARLHPKGKCPICSSLGDPVHHSESHHRIHTTFTSTRTETGRYASKAPNLQNIPIRSDSGALIRSAFIPSPGYKLVGADHSQIELRTLAHCSGDRLMRKIFREQGDIHDKTTAGIFKLAKVDKKEKLVIAADGSVIPWGKYSNQMRAPMKNINFGICIAEGTPVLTSAGIVPIEKVTREMKVWDGIEFVAHEGVLAKGVKETMQYDGLTATPSHNVWLRSGATATLYEASLIGSRLAVGEAHGLSCKFDRNPMRVMLPTTYMPARGSLNHLPVYDILNAGPRRRFTAAGKIVSNCYGLTPIGLQAQLALSGIYLSEDECAQLITQWFGFYTSVLPYMNEQHYRAKHYGLVWDMWGRVRYTPGVYSVHPKSVAEALREAGNQPIQAGATGMMKLGMWDMWCRDLEAFRGEIEVNPLLTVHDELIEEAPEHFADDLLALNVQLMCDVADLAVPIGAAGSAGYCWEK